jgi:dihydrofolate reductase
MKLGMGKIILGIDMTVDGVVESPDRWRFGFISNDLLSYDVQKINSLYGALLGRLTYEGFAAFWPTQKNNEFGIADKLNTLPKFVVSSTLKSADWNNSRIIRDNVEEEIIKLKKSSGGDIGITGSVTLAQWLMQRNLIDEYHLLVFPLVMGSGRRLFKEGTKVPLELVESELSCRSTTLLSKTQNKRNRISLDLQGIH